MKKIIALLLVGSLFLSGCKWCPSNEPKGIAAPLAQASPKPVVETVVSGLEVPWSLVFAPDGRLFITERPGRIRVYEHKKLRPKPLAVLSDVVSVGESGLLGMTLHPDFSNNHWLYVCYTKGAKDMQVVVKRYRESSTGLIDEKTIIDGIPAAQFHDGCRLRFGPDGKLYITTGDATQREMAQHLDSLLGKTLRLNDDGSIPSDNPFVHQQGARPEIFSYGHRNSQGLDFQPTTGLMFQTEHGPSVFDGPAGGDEVNVVEAGKNYGWPIIHHRMTKEGMESPILEYTPAVAPSGATFYRSNKIPEWQGNFFFACLRGETIIRVVLDGRKVIRDEKLLTSKYGRIRDIVEGPDGALYFATSNRDGRGKPAKNDDRVLRMSYLVK